MISTALANAILDHILGGGNYTRKASVYLAAMTAAPNAAGGGTEVTTSGGTAYARKAVTNNSTNWPAASARTKKLGVAQAFVTAAANWGTVVGIAIYDASTGGTLMHYIPFDSSVTVNSGDTLNLDVDSLQITIPSGGCSTYLANAVLDHIYGGGDFTRPSTLYGAGFVAPPTDAGGGTEPTGGGYARVTIANNSTNFPGASSGSKAMATTQSWPTASGDWGTITHRGYFDALSGGNLLFYHALDSSRSVLATNTARAAANALTQTCS